MTKHGAEAIAEAFEMLAYSTKVIGKFRWYHYWSKSYSDCLADLRKWCGTMSGLIEHACEPGKDDKMKVKMKKALDEAEQVYFENGGGTKAERRYIESERKKNV